MAEPKRSAPTVAYRHNVARARHEIGVYVDGLFVPFATLDDARVAQLVENERGAGVRDGAAEEGEEG